VRADYQGVLNQSKAGELDRRATSRLDCEQRMIFGLTLWIESEPSRAVAQSKISPCSEVITACPASGVMMA